MSRMAAAPRPFLIETPRLRLDAVTQCDARDLHRIVILPDVGRMLVLFPPDWPLAAARALIPTWAWRGVPSFRLAIRHEGRFVGAVGLREIEGKAWLAYFLDPAAAGAGLATEAVSAFCTEVGSRLGISVLHADVFTDNPASARVLEKCGFLHVGQTVGRSAARLEAAPLWVYRRGQTHRGGAQGDGDA